MKIALPVSGGSLSVSADSCERLYIYDLQDGSAELMMVASLNSLPHDPGLLPELLGDKGVDVVLVRAMDTVAREQFLERGIKVVEGMTNIGGRPQDIIRQYLSGSVS